jgi:hypothetical protein
VVVHYQVVKMTCDGDGDEVKKREEMEDDADPSC